LITIDLLIEQKFFRTSIVGLEITVIEDSLHGLQIGR